jgi:hypothetical protein
MNHLEKPTVPHQQFPESSAKQLVSYLRRSTMLLSLSLRNIQLLKRNVQGTRTDFHATSGCLLPMANKSGKTRKN